MSIKIWPYRQGSRGAQQLKRAINDNLPRATCSVLYPAERSNWRGRRGDYVINWGNGGDDRDIGGAHMLNHPRSVRMWSNKLSGFRIMEAGAQTHMIPYSENRDTAITWAQYPHHRVVCRTVLRGHSGEGIVIADTPEEVVDAPLYTLYMRKRNEYRIHFIRVGDNISFFTQQKRRNTSVPDEDVNWQIRNHDSGFIYAVDDVLRIDDGNWAGLTRAIDRITENLDFGAVDVLECNNSANNGTYAERYLILEVNTAPGIESPTLSEWYANRLIRRSMF